MMKTLKNQSYIPFISTKNDIEIASKTMKHAEIVRIPADYKYTKNMPKTWRLWIDPCFDAYPNISLDDKATTKNSEAKLPEWWGTWIKQFKNWEVLLPGTAVDNEKIRILVHSVLDHIAKQNPIAISVPQLIHKDASASHRLNRILAKETGTWKRLRENDIELVLPVVIADIDMYKLKQSRDSKIRFIKSALKSSTAQTCWVAHAGFDDLMGVSNYEHTTFPNMIKFHSELSGAISANCTIIAGPYWCLNLILWVRSLCDIPAISCGRLYRYLSPINPILIRSSANKIALPLYRRLYRCDNELKIWLSDAVKKYDTSSSQRVEIDSMLKKFSTFVASNNEPSRIQTAIFYESWFEELLKTHEAGRSLALFHDLSQAMVNGSMITEPLPKNSGLSIKARKAGFVAQQFMLQCLER